MQKLEKQTVYLPVKEDYGIYLGNFLGYPDGYSNVGNLKEIEAFVFTQEQLNQLLSDVIKDSLEVGAKNAKTFEDVAHFVEGSFEEINVDKQSITNQHSKILEKWKI